MQSQMTSRTLLPTASFSLRPQRLSQRCSAFRARVRHARSVRSVAASEVWLTMQAGVIFARLGCSIKIVSLLGLVLLNVLRAH